MGVLKNDVGRPSNKTIKTRAILKGILLIIVMVVIFISGYLLNDYQKKKIREQIKKDENKVVKTTNEKSEELDINSKEIMDLYLPFSYFTHEASDEELYAKDKITPDDLSTEYKNRLAFAKYYNEIDSENLYEGTVSIDKIGEAELDYLKSSTLEKSYKKLFGENAKYMVKSFDSYGIDTLSMTYNKEKDVYLADLAAGDYTGYRYGKELYKAIKVGNKIELYEHVVIYNEDYDKGLIGVFSNIEDANDFKNAIKQTKYDSDPSELIKYDETKQISHNGIYLDDLSDYKNKASQYKLTFEKEEKNYVFKQIEKIK